MGIFSKQETRVDTPVVVSVPAPEEEVEETPEVVVQTEELDSVEQTNKDNNDTLNPTGLVQTGTAVENPFRNEVETQAEYNERVPVGVQPTGDSPTRSYLGELL